MDKGRREHVAKSIETVTKKRNQIIQSGQGVPLLTDVLSRTSKELRVAATFQTQQLQSLSLPPHMKFLLWLTLQNDTYFRGGRAASERLSAARIGERVRAFVTYNSGTNGIGWTFFMFRFLINCLLTPPPPSRA